jgi:flagellum-specific ATP synthase
MPLVTTEQHRRAAHRLVDMMATYREAESLINIGAYVKGAIHALMRRCGTGRIRGFLRQTADEQVEYLPSIRN